MSKLRYFVEDQIFGVCAKLGEAKFPSQQRQDLFYLRYFHDFRLADHPLPGARVLDGTPKTLAPSQQPYDLGIVVFPKLIPVS